MKNMVINVLPAGPVTVLEVIINHLNMAASRSAPPLRERQGEGWR